jgi:hypothetical protein
MQDIASAFGVKRLVSSTRVRSNYTSSTYILNKTSFKILVQIYSLIG